MALKVNQFKPWIYIGTKMHSKNVSIATKNKNNVELVDKMME